ncbi:ATP-binding protein [Myceligenerans xiligouense]|uniref:DUF234 domain-containing protein n=1 Tax=Myceligenerans xiligouense TaxID=253184 RepID=A0A3N4ZCX6_9MICO|nr:ATP-binding protein [Myceligenerans xiligouense]RPF23322.1 hypothetical protein EDD34_4007 [Myceligenerans xiligouense]
MGFVGRKLELAELGKQLDVVRRGRRADRGVAVMIRGRRRIGKSRLVTEFVRQSGTPNVYFQAARRAPIGAELARLGDAIAESGLPGSDLLRGARFDSLTQALGLLAQTLPVDSPSVVTIDELPWLLEGIQGGAGELQRAWDLHLSQKPVLLLLLGSDIGMMERLTAHDQPFHGRATELVLRALNPKDVGEATGTAGFDAFDAALITGGQPLVVQEWEPGMSLEDFLRDSFASPTSALLVNGARVLDSEFREGDAARQVLAALGAHGERTFSGIQQVVGSSDGMGAAQLARILKTLAEKRVIAADEPLSARPAPKDRRYRIDDPALRFWLAFVEASSGDVDRGRSDLACRRVQDGYSAWRGRAVEPLVREALARLLPDDRWPGAREIGGWWPRTNRPEIDLVAADKRPAKRIVFVGTIKWRQNKPIKPEEMSALAADAASVPGATPKTALVAVCPAGGGAEADAVWTAEDLMEAWP